MNNKKSIFRFVTAAVCCLAIIFYGAYSFLFEDTAITAATAMTDETETYTQSGDLEPLTEPTTSSDPQKTATSSATKSAVAASSSGEALGKIIERYISPYTANTSYNNVYLKNSTDKTINIKSLLASPLQYKIEKNESPQVLIMHTHTTESFMTENRNYYTAADVSRTTDSSKNMVALGNVVTEKLNAAGIKTLHDTTMHDYPSYNESYNRASKTILAYKKKYPGIKIVIDMHRDAISASNADKIKLTADIGGKKAAQIMIVMGCQSGNIKNFPNWKENLKLGVRLQQTLEVMYPSLARSLSLMPRNYNESLTTGSMLIEIGTDGNTIEEVSYSAELLGNALANMLNTLT